MEALVVLSFVIASTAWITAWNVSRHLDRVLERERKLLDVVSRMIAGSELQGQHITTLAHQLSSLVGGIEAAIKRHERRAEEGEEWKS